MMDFLKQPRYIPVQGVYLSKKSVPETFASLKPEGG